MSTQEGDNTQTSRMRLLNAGKTLFAKNGYEQTSTAAIARESGSSESQLIRYFGGKAGLLEAIFNESFANFVGARGAERFFLARGDTALARRTRDDWEDDKRLGRFYSDLYRTLDSAFKANPDDEARRLQIRERLYADARRRLVEEIGPLLKTVPPRVLPRIQLDNAALLARRI